MRAGLITYGGIFWGQSRREERKIRAGGGFAGDDEVCRAVAVIRVLGAGCEDYSGLQ